MKIRVLHYFLAVAREGNMSAAAAALHVTQPTLSRQLAELEEELGVRLFVRRSHGVALTADGLRLRERAEEILELLEKTRAEFAAPGKPLTGDVHIGCGETREMRHLARAMQRTQAQWPGIRFHIHSGNFDDVTVRLDEGLLDFCLLIEPADLSKYDSMRLPDKDVWGVITPSDGPLAALPHVTRADLLGQPLILSRQAIRRSAAPNAFAEWFGEDFGRLHVAATYNLAYNAALMARCGLGHVLGLDGLADTREGSGLCFRLLEPRLESTWSVVWKKSRLFSPAAQAFFHALQEELRPADMPAK